MITNEWIAIERGMDYRWMECSRGRNGLQSKMNCRIKWITNKWKMNYKWMDYNRERNRLQMNGMQ